jgi:hypothetical protein
MSIKQDCLIILDIQRRFRSIMNNPGHTTTEEIQLGNELFGFLSTNPLSLRLATIRNIITRQVSYFEQRYNREGIWESLGEKPDPLDATNQLFHHMMEVQLHLLQLETLEKI